MLAGSAGKLVVWHDGDVYSDFSLYFEPLFLRSGDRTSVLLGAAAVFALGFLMRRSGRGSWACPPIGEDGRPAHAVGDAHVRGGSMIIACAPTLASIGVAAPVVLVVVRPLQGLSVGGDYGASATNLSEPSRVAVPGGDPHARRRAAVRDREHALRHRRVRRALAQATRHRARLLRKRHGRDRGLALV